MTRQHGWSAAVVVAWLSGCTATTQAARVNPLPNLAQVDIALFRGGQPSEEGIRQLATHGVKTVISLRHSHKGQVRERELAERLGLRWVNLPMRFWWRPTPQQIDQFLLIATDSANQPVFVHCHHGKDRTGIMVAMYRIIQDGWSRPHAYAEARRFGLGWWNLMASYVIFHDASQPVDAHLESREPSYRLAQVNPAPRLHSPACRCAAAGRRGIGVGRFATSTTFLPALTPARPSDRGAGGGGTSRWCGVNG